MIDLNQLAHSRDVLEIVHRDDFSCVRKTFCSDIDRARRNVLKQRMFQPLYTGIARVAAAEVIDFQIYEDRAELLMPYIEGMTGPSFAVHATRNMANMLSVSLSTMLYAELNESREAQVPTELFREKLRSVLSATGDSDLKALLESGVGVLSDLPDEMTFPLGPCHGDLTLSNVILDPVSGVTLIDFLDTYLESPLQDVAKLKQDFVYGWSFRKDPGSLGLKAEILCRHFIPQALLQIERMYPLQVQLLTLMTLARIAPYVRDFVTKKWFITSFTHYVGAVSQ